MRKLLFAVALVLGLACSPEKAHAVEMLLPDLTFAARGDGRTVDGTCPVTFSQDLFTLNVSSSVGDLMALNTGSGFSLVSGSVLSINLGPAIESGDTIVYPTGVITLATVDFSVTLATNGPLTLQETMVGFDALMFMHVVLATEGSPFETGQTLALDLHLFNVHEIARGIFCADVKGDLAPVVPEPTTISFIAISIAGLAARSRRKLVAA